MVKCVRLDMLIKTFTYFFILIVHPKRELVQSAGTNEMIHALRMVLKETYLNRDLIFVRESERYTSSDFALLARLPEGLGICVTAKDSEFDFVSRVFFPELKINEDPLTGGDVLIMKFALSY